MSNTKKRSFSDKETHLIQKIEQAKKELALLQDKRKTELGALAFKYGLNQFDNAVLETAFKKLSTELSL